MKLPPLPVVAARMSLFWTAVFTASVSGDHASGFCPEVDELFIGVRLKNWFVKEATRQTGRTSRDS